MGRSSRRRWVVGLSLLALALGGCCATTAASGGPGDPAEEPAAQAAPCQRIEGTGCYWMENETGHSCWVATPIEALTIEACAALDSCDGGGGASGGGCYKWADCSACERWAWPVL